MSTADLRAATTSGTVTPPTSTPYYGSTVPTPPKDLATARATKCPTGVAFFKSLYGILDLVLIISLLCVIICAGTASGTNCKQADNSPHHSSVDLSAYSTRNAVLAFAIIGLFLVIVDAILYATGVINRLPPIVETIIIFSMFILAVVIFILACCAAAWEQKMNDTVKKDHNYIHPGSAGAASFFLFVTTIVLIADYALRLRRPKPADIA